jgi:hypothetical protein
MKRLIARRPWLLVIAAFFLLISVWTCFIYIAVKHGPAVLPLDPAATSRHATH